MSEEEKQRSLAQNKAEHVWFKQIAHAYNEAGYEQKLTFGTIDAPWTEKVVKIQFQKLCKAMYGTHHTSELTTKQLSHVAEVYDREFLLKKGIDLPFPSFDTLSFNKTYGLSK